MKITRVTVTEAANLTKVGYVTIDVRIPQEYAQSHPVGAYNVPFKLLRKDKPEPNPDFVAVMTALFPKDTRLLVVAKIGKQSLEAAEVLVETGYQTVLDIRAGIVGERNDMGDTIESGWRTLGLPMEKVTDGRSYAELCAKAGIGS